MKHKIPSVLATALAIGFTPHVFADVVSEWNKITLDATKTGGLNTNLATRIDAIESIAVYDAVNSVLQTGTPYHYYAPTSPASAEAAAAQAAHDVLVNYFPAQQAALDTALVNSLAAIPDGSEETAGRAVGSAAAADIIALRANDGSAPNATYPGPASPGPGQWRPTPSAFASGINQQWGGVKPFLLPSGKVFRPGPPPNLKSKAYKKDLAEVQSLGQNTSSTRTDDQTHIAQFWKQDAELPVNEATRQLVEDRLLTLDESSLLFLRVNIALADTRIAIWDAKYTYNFWRPVTALNADPDGVVRNGYAAWQPLLATPPHPSYPSGHSGTVSAGFEVLHAFFGDWNPLTLKTTTPGEPDRTIYTLSQGEYENGISRIYGGIHYSFENKAGQKLGRRVAEYVLRHGPRELETGDDHDDDDDSHHGNGAPGRH